MNAITPPKRWSVDELKPLAIAAVKDGLQSEDKQVRAKAVDALIKMERQNQVDEAETIPAPPGGNRFLVIAQKLGIAGHIVAPAIVDGEVIDSPGGS